jgi:hypothetical protein
MLKRMELNENFKDIIALIATLPLPVRGVQQDCKRNFLRNMYGKDRLSDNWPINTSGVRNGYASNWINPSLKVFTYTLNQ